MTEMWRLRLGEAERQLRRAGSWPHPTAPCVPTHPLPQTDAGRLAAPRASTPLPPTTCPPESCCSSPYPAAPCRRRLEFPAGVMAGLLSGCSRSQDFQLISAGSRISWFNTVAHFCCFRCSPSFSQDQHDSVLDLRPELINASNY